jgi:hypothetical protein
MLTTTPLLPVAHENTSAREVPTAKESRSLSLSAKVGIGVGIGVIGLMLAFAAFLTASHWRHTRRERAMLNAIEEIERGGDKGSEERIVLESRISIVFDDGIEEEEEEQRGRGTERKRNREEEEQRGRQGFSLRKSD